MSELVQILEQLAVSTAPQSKRQEEVSRLTQDCQLSQELTDALQSADLSGLIQAAGVPGRGCFLIVAPEEPEQPDEDEPQDEPVKIRRH
ncbi:hypothetical protein [Rheinheimera tilapiae]|uniref:Uncharacterized protein n=1 Tax=Rheinheimera tilapiae TaxID=875043 RepID=A0ABV6BAZ5_9GAMM